MIDPSKKLLTKDLIPDNIYLTRLSPTSIVFNFHVSCHDSKFTKTGDVLVTNLNHAFRCHNRPLRITLHKFTTPETRIFT